MTKLEDALRAFATAGFQIDRGGFEFLRSIVERVQFQSVVQNTISQMQSVRQTTLIITRELLESIIERVGAPSTSIEPSVTANVMRTNTPLAKDVAAHLDIINDPSQKIGSTGSVDNFTSYFKHRFRVLSKILNERMEVSGAGDIASALKSSHNITRFICMISAKRDRKTHMLLEVEDEENQALLLVQREDTGNYEFAQSVPLDQVVYVEAKRTQAGRLICTKIILPDVPDRKPSTSPEPVCAALLSDVHAGSKTFMDDAFERLVTWLNCRVDDSRNRDLASRVKYLIIAGDIVDGVGIYPNQEDELTTDDVYEQYKLAARYISQVPEYIEVILIPGNHDPTRQSLPQPRVAEEFAEPIYKARKVHSFGNPTELGLHGVRFLVYHGRSLDDIITTVPGMTYEMPHLAMEFLLRCRHLAPEYGKRTPIAPDVSDQLVIQKPPDIFHAGHIHINGIKKYRGTTIINSGAWQRQTEYQRRMGLEPTPGLIPIVDLHTLEVTQVNFV